MWHEIDNNGDGKELVKSFDFADFNEAIAFTVRVAMIAEKMNHHPTITIEYNKVQIRTSTHDAGDTITEKDRQLTAQIDKIIK